MKKILCLALVLILTMSVAMTASAADASIPSLDFEEIGKMVSSIQLPSSLDEAFNNLAEFIKFEGIMVYVNQFHDYMVPFYEELNVALKGIGVVINGFVETFLGNLMVK